MGYDRDFIVVYSDLVLELKFGAWDNVYRAEFLIFEFFESMREVAFGENSTQENFSLNFFFDVGWIIVS